MAPDAVLTDADVWEPIDAFFAEDPTIATLFAPSSPLGVVLRQCLRVDPRTRIAMAQVERLLRGQDGEVLRSLSSTLPSTDTSHGLSGTLDEEDD